MLLLLGTFGRPALAAKDRHLSDYAAGCKALRVLDWQKAEFWFREALEANPKSLGKPVPWSGENSQIYLPRYVIGVSLFGLGRYQDALQEWRLTESEWQGLPPRTDAALTPYREVIRQGREIYRQVVCGEVVRSAFDWRSWTRPEKDASGDGKGAEQAEAEIRELCLSGQFSVAVERARTLAKQFEPDQGSLPPRAPGAGPANGTSFENVPAAFAQEVSDCEAPRRLKLRTPAAGSTGMADFEPGGAPALDRPRRLPGAAFARFEQPPRVISAGPTMADLAKRVEGVYAKKVALLISPDYKGTQWAEIAGADKVLTSLKSGLLRWGFKEADIHPEPGKLKADVLRARIDSFVREENAAYLTPERNLVLVYFLGHVYRRDENDSGLLITSDSPPPPRPGDDAGYRKLVKTSVSASIVMTFANQAPHHLVFMFDACSFGEPFLGYFGGATSVPWESAWQNPALLLIARSASSQVTTAKPALTEALAQELTGCGNADRDGIATGYRLFSSVARAVEDKGSGNPQSLKVVLPLAWRNGDIVLRAPPDCRKP